jgi:alpha-ketoglutarate-dependent taurine dioxygenase
MQQELAPGVESGGLGGNATHDELRSRVSVRPLADQHAIPLLVEPTERDVDLIEWARSSREYVEELLLRHRALLFRGFKTLDVAGFGAFVDATSRERLEYRDRTTPRTTKGDRLYTSTIHPADQRIEPHNEGTYWRRWPAKLYLTCVVAPDSGGETPIGDVRRVLQNIPEEIKARFAAKRWMLVRNYNDGFGLPWEEVFQTTSKAEVEQYCKQNDIRFEWKSGGRLRTAQIRPAVRNHPRTGEEVWFNHAAFFHYTSLEEQARAALLAEFGEAGLPYNTYYGDGSRIQPETAAVLRTAYAKEKVSFRWRQGDVVLIDNLSIYHAREAYAGKREVLVAMADTVVPEALPPKQGQ